MTLLAGGLLLADTLVGAQDRQTFVGIITDDVCGGSHAQMQMGPTDAECTRACVVAHGAQFALYDGKNVYVVREQGLADKFAGQKVRIVGTLDAKTRTIHADSIAST